MTIGLLTAQGCIIPQEEYFLETPQPRLNRPVRIIPQTVTPPENRLQTGNGATCAIEFTLFVEDPDVSDPIQFFYFIDYDRTRPTNPVYAQGVLAAGTSTNRSQSARALFRAADLITPLFSPGEHAVEVVVTDTTLDAERTATPVSETDAGTNPGYTDSFTWFVSTVPGDCP